MAREHEEKAADVAMHKWHRENFFNRPHTQGAFRGGWNACQAYWAETLGRLSDAQLSQGIEGITPAGARRVFERMLAIIGIQTEAAQSVQAAERCPRCNSPKPELHPAMQWEGEVEVCKHPWHKRPEFAPEGGK